MKKRFNITGTCHPDSHYMMNNANKLEAVMDLIAYGDYFSINRPRQFGKTTTLFLIAAELIKQEDYVPIQLNFQGIDSSWHESDTAFAQMFVSKLLSFFEEKHIDLFNFLNESKNEIHSMDDLSKLITALIKKINKKVVLLIDEVDSSSNYSAFLVFLGMLRTKFLARDYGDKTFHSVVLAGVHDIKNLKFKLRNPDDAQYNSPWNIAVDFEVRMSFNPEEIAPMLEQYSEAENVKMDISAIAERLYYYTSGYPFLVSKLCKNIAEKIVAKRENKNEWTLEDVEESVRILLKESNTNFESLIKNLENNKDLYDLVYAVTIEGANIPFNGDEPVTQLGKIYGIFKANGQVKIHNKIYEQRIYNYLSSKRLQQFISEKNYTFGDTYLTDSGELDLERVLRKFQLFMKEQRSKKDFRFIEREWRLVFLAFLKPILNGKGHDFKEVETSEEKRLDIVVTYLQYKYIIELKLWKGEKAHGKGLHQLANYLDIHSVNKGYLLIFDDRKKPTWEVKNIEYEGKEIFAVWV